MDQSSVRLVRAATDDPYADFNALLNEENLLERHIDFETPADTLDDRRADALNKKEPLPDPISGEVNYLALWRWS